MTCPCPWPIIAPDVRSWVEKHRTGRFSGADEGAGRLDAPEELAGLPDNAGAGPGVQQPQHRNHFLLHPPGTRKGIRIAIIIHCDRLGTHSHTLCRTGAGRELGE